MHAGPLSLVQSSHLGVVAGPDRTQRSSRSMVSTRARGTTRHLFGIRAATTRRRWPNTRGHTAADRRRRLGVCLWSCPLVTGIFSSHPLPLPCARAVVRAPDTNKANSHTKNQIYVRVSVAFVNTPCGRSALLCPSYFSMQPVCLVELCFKLMYQR